jgi:DNA polymerase (family 10)
MDRAEVADRLEEIGLLLELLGENPFKTRAYANAARIVRGLDANLVELIQRGQLAGQKGIGPALVDKITTLVTTGELPYLDSLRKQLPAELLTWLKIPGLGPKKARVIHVTLGIATLAELEQAAQTGKLRDLPGFGESSEKKILAGIARVREQAGRFLRPVVLDEAARILRVLSQVPGLVEAQAAGSARRGAETSKDIDIVATATDAKPVIDAFAAADEVVEIVGRGPTKCSVQLRTGPNADLRVVPAESYAFALMYFTGSKAHNVALRARAQSMGMKLNEYALIREADGVAISCADEAAIYRALGLPYIAPELREDRGEIEAAEKGALPKLIERADLKGILHCHSNWSDGTNTIEEMALAARAMGMSYLGLCDHSRSAAYAGGMSIERVAEQHREIDALNAKLGPSFHVLKGIECDILADGAMDYPDEVLQTFDLVVASVHSRFNLDEKEQTARMIRAVDNPYVDIIGHPTGRLLLTRDPYPIDIFAVIDAAAGRGVAIEINAHPSRLDLDPAGLRRGIAAGMKTSIDPDSHETAGLSDIVYGIDTARRGWCTAADVLNALSLPDLLNWLADRRARALG